MNGKLFIAFLFSACFLFISAGKAHAFDKDSFNVLNAPKMLDKQLFEISANDVVKEKCHDCDCGCKESGKCKCGEKCPCDCGCGKSGKCKCKSANPLEIKDRKPKSWTEIYNHVADGGKATVYIGVDASDKTGVWIHLDSHPSLSSGTYDCYSKNGVNLMQKRVENKVIQDCPNGQCPNQIYNSCPNGQCPRR